MLNPSPFNNKIAKSPNKVQIHQSMYFSLFLEQILGFLFTSVFFIFLLAVTLLLITLKARNIFLDVEDELRKEFPRNISDKACNVSTLEGGINAIFGLNVFSSFFNLLLLLFFSYPLYYGRMFSVDIEFVFLLFLLAALLFLLLQ